MNCLIILPYDILGSEVALNEPPMSCLENVLELTVDYNKFVLPWVCPDVFVNLL